jgi:hypothetical protein
MEEKKMKKKKVKLNKYETKKPLAHTEKWCLQNVDL